MPAVPLDPPVASAPAEPLRPPEFCAALSDDFPPLSPVPPAETLLPPPTTALSPPAGAPPIELDRPPPLAPAALRPALGSDEGELSLLPQPNMTLMPDAASNNDQQFEPTKKLTLRRGEALGDRAI